jgi:amidophosphoribosyltransferase
VKEACGVFGVIAPGRDVAQLTFDGLYALQHRGQESAGMAVSDGRAITVVKDMGLVTTVFDERTISCLPGDLAIGHTRYSTTGASEWRNAQPVFRAAGTAGFALGHNGNLTNTAELAERAGMLPGVVASDSDLMAELLHEALSVAASVTGHFGDSQIRSPGGTGGTGGTGGPGGTCAPHKTGGPGGTGSPHGTGAHAGGGYGLDSTTGAAGGAAGTAVGGGALGARGDLVGPGGGVVDGPEAACGSAATGGSASAGGDVTGGGAASEALAPGVGTGGVGLGGGLGGGPLEVALRRVLPDLRGAFSLVLMDEHRMFGVRDPNGLRPLCLGRFGPPDAPAGWVLASESPALDVVGAAFVRDVGPGELVVVDGDGPRSAQLWSDQQIEPRLCIFEFVYFARPDARLYGHEVHGARRRMGELLATQRPVDADMVMGVPESGVPAAEGYSRRSGIPYGQGLVKNRYIGRTFITPGQAARAAGVRRKLNPLRENIAGKRIVVVDDSVVRGTTQRAVVAMLRESGAAEVHLRVSSPPLAWPCFYGIDIPKREQLLASERSVAEIAQYLNVDSLEYLSLENLVQAIDAPGAGFCDACLTGSYPVPVSLPALRTVAAASPVVA